MESDIKKAQRSQRQEEILPESIDQWEKENTDSCRYGIDKKKENDLGNEKAKG